MSNKISWLEPADRPYSVALSDAEVLALVNHHVAQTKKVTKYVGKKLLVLSASSPLPKTRESNALIDEGRKMVEAHLARAKGLQSILKK